MKRLLKKAPNWITDRTTNQWLPTVITDNPSISLSLYGDSLFDISTDGELLNTTGGALSTTNINNIQEGEAEGEYYFAPIWEDNTPTTFSSTWYGWSFNKDGGNTRAHHILNYTLTPYLNTYTIPQLETLFNTGDRWYLEIDADTYSPLNQKAYIVFISLNTSNPDITTSYEPFRASYIEGKYEIQMTTADVSDYPTFLTKLKAGIDGIQNKSGEFMFNMDISGMDFSINYLGWGDGFTTQRGDNILSYQSQTFGAWNMPIGTEMTIESITFTDTPLSTLNGSYIGIRPLFKEFIYGGSLDTVTLALAFVIDDDFATFSALASTLTDYNFVIPIQLYSADIGDPASGVFLATFIEGFLGMLLPPGIINVSRVDNVVTIGQNWVGDFPVIVAGNTTYTINTVNQGNFDNVPIVGEVLDPPVIIPAGEDLTTWIGPGLTIDTRITITERSSQ